MRRLFAMSMFVLLLGAGDAAAFGDPHRCADQKVTVRPDSSRALFPFCSARVVITRAPQHGQVEPQLRATGTMRYVPHPGYTGPDSFAFRNADQPAGTPDAEVEIEVTAANRPPYCTARPGIVAAGVVTHPFACSDPDEGDSVRIHVATAPRHGRVEIPGGQPQYHPSPGYAGPDSFVVRADDGTNVSPDVKVDVAVEEPTAPVCQDVTATARREGRRPIPIDCATNAGPLNFTIEMDYLAGLGHGSLVRDMFSTHYVPDVGFTGADALTTRVAWPAPSNPFEVTFDVTEKGTAPACDQIPGRLQVRQGRTTDVLVFCHDGVDLDKVQLAVPEKPYRGAIAASQFGQFVYTADAGYAGADRFGVQGSDDALSSPVLHQKIHVLGDDENTEPVCLPTSSVALYGGSGGITVACMDAEGDPLTYEIVTPPANGQAALNSHVMGLSLAYTAGPSFPGADVVTYRAKDDRGGRSAVMAMRVHAAPPVAQPGPPRCMDIEPQAMRPGTSRTFWIACGDPATPGWITPEIVDPPEHGTLTSLGYGEYFTYVPDEGFTGHDEMILRATTAGGQDDTKLSIDVDPAANVAPMCGRERERVTRGAVTLPTGCGDADNDPLDYAVSDAPDHGSLSGDPSTGSVTYTPAGGYTGVDTFEVTVSDGHGGSARASRVIRVRGEDVNVRPYCNIGHPTIGVNQSVGLHPGCQDGDGDALTIGVTAPPQHGTLEPDPFGGLTYTPHPGFKGIDRITLVADDGRSTSQPYTVQVNVVDWSQPYAATCRTMAANVAIGQPRPLTLRCQFPDGFAPEIVQAPEHGDLSDVAGDGTVTYTPDPGYSGPDSFLYRGRKGEVVGVPALVTLDVREAPPLPVDVVDDRAIGPQPGSGLPRPTPSETPTPTPTPAPAAPEAPPAGGGAARPSIVSAPSLYDLALQAMGGPMRGVIAELGPVQAYLPATPPVPGTRSTKLLALACPQACGIRVKAKLVSGRRSVPLPARALTLAAGRAGAVEYRITKADRRRLGRPKRGVLSMHVKVRDAAGAVHRDEIRVRLVLR